ncbi:hypothetical protein B2J86_12930 [Acidovorax sp. SRB_14]|uniref:EF-hand domain-containing protein n=1 Tax=Acidovorax sp. SRB_14 TaxID=1962699 RepID=UPI0015636CF0|nr:EF-hand domain-containing protein [Acidovorax sp. SRB_14]NMM81815.1 hypothetical protein [Acidovorax sp. SRB_14]
MHLTKQRTAPFDARSVLLFAALALGGAAAVRAQTAPGASSPNASGPAATVQTATHSPRSGSGSAHSATETAFVRADTNHDGKLSATEAAALPAIGNRFQQLDADKDGFLSRAEFEKGAQP